jgi:hypothetical protein
VLFGKTCLFSLVWATAEWAMGGGGLTPRNQTWERRNAKMDEDGVSIDSNIFGVKEWHRIRYTTIHDVVSNPFPSGRIKQ